jgi:hypothetical protein
MSMSMSMSSSSSSSSGSSRGHTSSISSNKCASAPVHEEY